MGGQDWGKMAKIGPFSAGDASGSQSHLGGLKKLRNFSGPIPKAVTSFPNLSQLLCLPKPHLPAPISVFLEGVILKITCLGIVSENSDGICAQAQHRQVKRDLLAAFYH